MKIRSPRFVVRRLMTAAYLSATLVLVPACSSGDSDSGAVSACEFYCYCNSSLDCPNAGEQCVDSTCVPGFGDVGPDTTEPSTDVVEDTDTDVVDPNDTDTDTDIPTSCLPGETLSCECSGVLEGVRLCNQAGSYTGCDCGEGPETGLCSESGCTSEEVELYLARVLEAAGASLDDAASLTAIWSNPEELASVVSATLSAMAFPVSASGPGEKAACLFLAEYDPNVAYCGAGCSTDALSWTTIPGDCLNRACFEHDSCYNNFECSVGSKVELECVFSAATSCCDDAMDVRADACEAGGSGRTGASLPVPGAVFAAAVAGGSSLVDAAAAEAEATEARLAAFAEDVRFRTVRLIVARMRASTRESCVSDVGGAATCMEPEVRGTCDPLICAESDQECVIGSQRCTSENAVEQCTLTLGDPCPRWREPVACEAGQICDRSLGECVDDCRYLNDCLSPTCVPTERMECIAGGYFNRNRSRDGYHTLEVVNSCAEEIRCEICPGYSAFNVSTGVTDYFCEDYPQYLVLSPGEEDSSGNFFYVDDALDVSGAIWVCADAASSYDCATPLMFSP